MTAIFRSIQDNKLDEDDDKLRFKECDSKCKKNWKENLED